MSGLLEVSPRQKSGASMQNRGARVLQSKTLYEGNVFSVRQDRIAEPGGMVVTRDIVVHRGSVVLLPVFPDGSILLVRQYRHALGTFLWELVAGRVEAGESRPAPRGSGRIAARGGTARTHRGNRLHRAPRASNSGALPFSRICHRAHVGVRRHGIAARPGAAGRGRAHPLQKIFSRRSGKDDPPGISARRKIRRSDSLSFAISPPWAHATFLTARVLALPRRAPGTPASLRMINSGVAVLIFRVAGIAA